MSANQPTSDGPHDSLDAGISEQSRSSANPSSSSGEDRSRSRRRTYCGPTDDHQQRVSPKKKTRTGEEVTPKTSSAGCSGSEDVNMNTEINPNSNSRRDASETHPLDVPNRSNEHLKANVTLKEFFVIVEQFVQHPSISLYSFGDAELTPERFLANIRSQIRQDEASVVSIDSSRPEVVRRQFDVPVITVDEAASVSHTQEQLHRPQPTRNLSPSLQEFFNQPSTSASLSSGQPSSSHSRLSSASPHNLPSTSSAHSPGYPLADLGPAERLGNVGLAGSPSLNPRSTVAAPIGASRRVLRRSRNCSQTQPSASVNRRVPDLPLEDIRPSVEKSINFPDRFMFSHTMFHMLRKKRETKSTIPPHEANYIFGILAMIELLFTENVLTEKPSNNQKGMVAVRIFLQETPRLSDLAVVILRKLSAIVSHTDKPKQKHLFSREFYPFFYTLVVIVGSFKQLARHMFPSNTLNDDELLKQIVHEIIFFLEEKCMEAMRTRLASKIHEDRRNHQKNLFRPTGPYESSAGSPYRTKTEVLRNLHEIVKRGFSFVNIRQEFPTPDMLLLFATQIRVTVEAGGAINSGSRRCYQVVRPIVEKPINDALYEVFSIVTAVLYEVMHARKWPNPGQERGWHPVARSAEEETPETNSIDEMLETLSAQCRQMREGRNDKTLFQEIKTTVDSVFKQLMSERKDQESKLLNWKRTSKEYIVKFLASSSGTLNSEEPEEVVGNLASIFQYFNECYQPYLKVQRQIDIDHKPLREAVRANDFNAAMKYTFKFIGQIKKNPPNIPDHI